MSLYSIKDLEHLSGIKAHTIRIWEKRYRLLDPERSDTNIRAYNDNDVRKILNVALLVKSGYKISSVASFDAEKLKSEVIRVGSVSPDVDKYTDKLLYQTVNLDVNGFESVLNQVIAEFGFGKAIQSVFFPYFERIGVLWQAGSVFTAHEHFVSNLIRNRLINEISKLEENATKGQGIFFLREGEWHELGLLYSVYLASTAGYRAVYLGQSLPFSDLANVVAGSRYDFVCTSFIIPFEKPEFEQYLSNLSLLFNQTKILIFGRQVAIQKPKLPANVFAVKNLNDFLRKVSL